MNRRTGLFTLFLLIGGVFMAQQADAQQVATLEGSSPLVQIRIMVKAGSAQDMPGKEGLAYLTARLLLEGSFGEEAHPMTRQTVAERTAPWGSGAQPSVRVGKEATTFSMTVPREVLGIYIQEILEPMLARPLFDEQELERVRGEVLTYVSSSLRNENLELLGLEALDDYIYEGTTRGHLVQGSVEGLGAVTRRDMRRFYNTWYRPSNIIIGLGSDDAQVRGGVVGAVKQMGRIRDASAFTSIAVDSPFHVQGREMVIVAQPNAPAAVVNIGFPIPLTRADVDFWPLWVANVWLGTHRDSFSHLYQVIRQERGYNYGDYSYIEHFANRPANLFPPFNTPRTSHYFSIWIRPIAPEYVHHLTKAAMWELEDLIRQGLSDEQVAAAKNKVKVLYLNYAETADRLLEARVDDLFYGMRPGTPQGYLDGYLERIDRVTTEQVNAAIRTYLQTQNVKILVVTDADHAQGLADEVAAGGPAWGKRPAEYGFGSRRDGDTTLWEILDTGIDMIRRDGAWGNYWLWIATQRIRVVPVDALFETGDFIPPGK